MSSDAASEKLGEPSSEGKNKQNYNLGVREALLLTPLQELIVELRQLMKGLRGLI